jgi:YD repeat-containing protein
MTYESTYSQVASVTDPLNHATSFAYDSKGNLTGITDPLKPPDDVRLQCRRPTDDRY